ncbi:hypothetical protein RIR_jg32255.t1 [Rhizophagus irregularis DAOM 181602=DAOM 197198]|uniref:Uncharacterized protein n=1 Tax=Rhizophagus irregularis (strain DAOM 197198w) TaxID=1432141 RepID=A0A015IRB1_RHIIW|nr:hypothetical protein RirG_186370 [Rhizophagus irregularis DAOM 197198w]GET49999.1 hypothetical protein RIR_jg32255.t1 [Rhizophagus irregularis DAOM 181602=DAOM 197198]
MALLCPKFINETQSIIRRSTNLEEGQLTVDDTRFNAKRYSHSKVLRYDEGLRDTIQYWMRRRAELDKVSENDFLYI